MKKVEDMTVDEMREFAEKANIAIPDKLKKKTDILAHLKDLEKKTAEEPKAEAEEKAVEEPKKKSVEEMGAQRRKDKEKRQAKIPLKESEKTRLAQLEVLARSGKSPDIDQMKELRMLRMRKNITPLSKVEVRELEELEVKAQGGEVDPVKDSGLPQEERLSELRKRSTIK